MAERNSPARTESPKQGRQAEEPLYQCRICFASSSAIFEVREMMTGTRDVFRYFECPGCGSVQIAEIPDCLERYYNNNYYSFTLPSQPLYKRLALKVLAYIGQFSPHLRQFIRQRHYGLEQIYLFWEFARSRKAYILDVGAGAGKLVRDLFELGYENVLGIDPFLTKDISYQGKILVRRADIFNIDGRWDIISFNHSLEHMAEQRAVLERARKLLSTDGCIIVRIPVVGGDAWQKYREHWVQLDAPRHLHLHSLRSLKIVAREASLDISRVFYDSRGFQFWGSELYCRDIPLNDPRSPAVNRKTSVFTARQMAEFERLAREANRAGAGDQIVAVLTSSTGNGEIQNVLQKQESWRREM